MSGSCHSAAVTGSPRGAQGVAVQPVVGACLYGDRCYNVRTVQYRAQHQGALQANKYTAPCWQDDGATTGNTGVVTLSNDE